jgi:Family of unknown function (DUF6352)
MTEAQAARPVPQREFWVSSGHQLTRRGDNGGLIVTDELLTACLARPELVPPAEACAAERALHGRLMANPRAPVAPADIAAIADADARENWTFMLVLRDRLAAAPTVEAAYMRIVREGVRLPVLFLNQLAHLILRNALDGCADPYVLRGGELLFRAQRASYREGTLLLADDEIVEAFEAEKGTSPLNAMLGKDAVADLDIMDDINAWTYWSRSDAHSMVMALGSNPKARAGLAAAIEAWVRHLLDVRVSVTPQADIQDRDWRWFVGLDQDATAFGNALWKGKVVEAEARERVIALFRLDFADPRDAKADLGKRPVYLILAMTPDRKVYMKPQNLLAGLPLADGRGV